ncbi:hypothetical protein TEP_16795 [Stenotrophomonas sp. TEPEL]|uniref:EamA family transporter n=1 Tax=Stenotrophomonas sp. TEPEL TaxID=2283801 RepID=UPI001049C607|nr:EamA family transporter [Stenotrophomonas sp. TEPEL]TDB35158.1 hypothetical protein TEP_16795 [Stenotrophomonas sp. TEPEL]
MAYIFIALTILLTVYGQLVLKWQVGQHPHLISAPFSLLNIVTLLLKPWVISGFAAAFAASLCWMAAISRLPLSKAYPFMSCNFVLVALMAAWLFREQLDGFKIAGTLIIIFGVIVVSRSA